MVMTCEPGVTWTTETWNGEWKNPHSMLWAVIVGGFLMCFMAFGIGANDSANSWGTSVGSKAISLRLAMIIGGCMEFLGATTLGYGVSTTIQKGVSQITDPDCFACGYCDSKMSLFMVAMLSALFGAAVFLLLATFTAMPVSTTHAIVGASVGGAIVATSFACLNWSWHGGLTAIIASWFISPIFSGMIGIIMYLLTYHFIVNTSSNAEKRAILSLPLLYGVTTTGLSMLILIKSKPLKSLHTGVKFLMALGLGLVIGLLAQFLLVPFVKRKIQQKRKDSDSYLEMSDFQEEADYTSEKNLDLEGFTNGNGTDAGRNNVGADDVGTAKIDSESDNTITGENNSPSEGTEVNVLGTVQTRSAGRYTAIFVFQYLLVFVAAWESFAHGANDTANATGAFAAIYTTYKNGFSVSSCQAMATPVWVMAIGGLFVFIGMNVLGGRVIRTVGENITEVNFHTGIHNVSLEQKCLHKIVI